MTTRIYGRTEYAEPLVEVTIVDDGAAAVVDGEWVELVAFDDDAMHWIIRDGDEVDDA